MNILNKLKRSNGVRVGLCLAACLLGSRVAQAEVQLADKDGWTFTFDGRVNAFLSAGFGDGLPAPTGMGMHTVMGTENDRVDSIPDVGWQPNYGQLDANRNFTNIRVRSGFYPNILGFAVTRKMSDTTSVRGYVSIWATVESMGEDKWAPISPIAREGYLTVTGPWGSASVGRMLGFLGRMSYEIDTAYGHGFGVGLPCTDSLGPACGHIGTGELFPGYSAGMAYSTPSLGGLKLQVGLYDPIIFSAAPDDWSRAGIPRPEGTLTFEKHFSETAYVKIGVEGLYQPLQRTCMDAGGNMTTCNGSVWGASGGARLAAGPVRAGFSGFTGQGIGLFYALQRTHATEDQTRQLRRFTGLYGQLGLEFGSVLLTGGYGISYVAQTDNDKANTMLSVIRYQMGISGGVYFHASDAIVIGLDYFNFAAGWWGAPLGDGTHLVGETQRINFVNAGVTYYW